MIIRITKGFPVTISAGCSTFSWTSSSRAVLKSRSKRYSSQKISRDNRTRWFALSERKSSGMLERLLSLCKNQHLWNSSWKYRYYWQGGGKGSSRIVFNTRSTSQRINDMSKGTTSKMQGDIFRKHSTERFRTARWVLQPSSRNNGVHAIKAELTIYKK